MDTTITVIASSGTLQAQVLDTCRLCSSEAVLVVYWPSLKQGKHLVTICNQGHIMTNEALKGNPARSYRLLYTIGEEKE